MAKKQQRLEELTITELKEMINRQSILLSNKKFISKLPDKGEKIKINLEKLTTELERRNDVDRVGKLLSALNINEPSKSNVQDIEWKGRLTDDSKTEVLDSDDDSDTEDPLKIIAQSTDVKKKVVILKRETLINEEDLKEIKSFDNNDNQIHVQYLCDQTVNRMTPQTKGLFKPYKTTKTDVHDYAKDLIRNQKRHWDVTAATPPPLFHGPVKEIPLMESLKLQEEHNKTLKEMQTKQASERLAAQLGTSISKVPPSVATQEYRDPQQTDTEDENEEPNSEDEVHDEEPEKGGVSFPVED